MKPTADRLVDDYLKRLNKELSDLPLGRRRELADEIAGHITEARADLEAENEVEIRNLLERLGDPAEIATEERARSGVQPRRAGPVEIVALIGLLVGGFFAAVGWFVGLVLLWVSEAWTTREKLVGTFVVPGGLATGLFLGTIAVGPERECVGESDPRTGLMVETCTGGGFGLSEALWTAVLVVLVAGPIFTTVFLARRMKRPLPTGYQPSSGAA